MKANKKSKSRKARRHHKSNSHAHASSHGTMRRYNSSRRRKRNDAGTSGLGMRLLKAAGATLLGAAVAVGGMLLLSATSLSAAYQDGILIAGGVVLGGALVAMGKPGLGVALMTGPITLGLSRRVIAWGITSRAQQLVQSITGTTATTTAPASTTAPAQGFLGYAPGGYLTAAPSWQHGAAQAAQLRSVANMTTPMVYGALG